MQIAAAEPVDGAAELAAAAVERGGDLRVERRRPARRVGPVEHDDRVDAVEGGGESRGGERPERRQLEEANGPTLLAQLVDDVLDRSRRRAEGDDRRRRALEPVVLELAVAAAAEVGELDASSANAVAAASIAAACWRRNS